MSFKTKTPKLENDAVPVEQESLDSVREVVPVPWVLGGKRKVAVRWITAIVEQQAVEIKESFSKK